MSSSSSSFSSALDVQCRRCLHDAPACSIALDCEMVGCGERGDKSVLARVSITDCLGKELLDTYVQPGETVTDYRSAVSGITAKILLEKGAVSFHEARRRALELLERSDCLIVGHSLENDFECLDVVIPPDRVRDTAQCPLLCGGRPRKLRDLARERLGMVDFQRAGKEHDSVQDARVVMQLYITVRDGWEVAIRNSAADGKLEAASVHEFRAQPSLENQLMRATVKDYFAASDQSLPFVQDQYASVEQYCKTFRPLIAEENRATIAHTLQVHTFSDEKLNTIKASFEDKQLFSDGDSTEVLSEKLDGVIMTVDLLDKKRIMKTPFLPFTYILMVHAQHAESLQVDLAKHVPRVGASASPVPTFVGFPAHLLFLV